MLEVVLTNVVIGWEVVPAWMIASLRFIVAPYPEVLDLQQQYPPQHT